MNDFIDHLLARSFGLEDAENKLQPRMPSLFEARQGDAPLDAPRLEEEETPDPESTSSRSRAPYTDAMAISSPLDTETRQQGVLLPPEPNRDPAVRFPYQEPPQPASKSVSPSTPKETLSPSVKTVETIARTEIIPSDRPALTPALADKQEQEASKREPVEPPGQPPTPSKRVTEPVQPAPVRLETIEKTDTQAADKAPNIRVHIGRIEVQIPQPTSQPAVNKAPPAQPRAPFRPPMNLSEYMDKRRSKR